MTRNLAAVFVSLLVVAAMDQPRFAVANQDGDVRRLPIGRQPNVIVILADDLGYNDLGCYGARDIATPSVDRMADQGVSLTSFYVSPVCSPSRASLMTGCYSQRVGIGGVLFQRSTVGLGLGEATLPELLKAQGYATTLIGKWHLGFRSSQNPLHHGFDEWFGTVSSNSTLIDPFDHELAEGCVFREGLNANSVYNGQKVRSPLLRNNRLVEVPADQTLFTQRYAEETIRFIAEHKDEPFFVYLAHNMPHIPLHVSQSFAGQSSRGLYGDVIQELDSSVGQILDALKELNLDDQTLVIFTSDNGPKREAGGSALPLRGGKGSSFEGGVRVPWIARWPSRIPPGHVCDEPVTINDVLPTLATLAGANVPDDRVIDGKDIWPLISGDKRAKSPHEAIYYWKGRSLKGIRVGDWKLINETEEKKVSEADIELTSEQQQLPRSERKAIVKARLKELKGPKKAVTALYNLRNDIGETADQLTKNPEIASRLRAMLHSFQDELRNNQRPAERAE